MNLAREIAQPSKHKIYKFGSWWHFQCGRCCATISTRQHPETWNAGELHAVDNHFYP